MKLYSKPYHKTELISLMGAEGERREPPTQLSFPKFFQGVLSLRAQVENPWPDV